MVGISSDLSLTSLLPYLQGDPFAEGGSIGLDKLGPDIAKVAQNDPKLRDGIDSQQELEQLLKMLNTSGGDMNGLPRPNFNTNGMSSQDMLAALIDWIQSGGPDANKKITRPAPIGHLSSPSNYSAQPASWSGGGATNPAGGMSTGGSGPSTSTAPAGSGPTVGPTKGPVNKDTKNMSEAEKFDHYKSLIEQNGGKLDANGRNVIAIRNPTDADTNGGNGAYDDVTAVVWQDANGDKHAQEFRSNTEPVAHYRGSMGDDADGNGTLDQGRLKPGNYRYEPTTYKGNPAFAMQGDAQVDRDTNADGVFGNDGGASSGGANSMLFHVGGTDFVGSAGCQTFAPDQFQGFLAAVGGNGFNYTLVNNA